MLENRHLQEEKPSRLIAAEKPIAETLDGTWEFPGSEFFAQSGLVDFPRKSAAVAVDPPCGMLLGESLEVGTMFLNRRDSPGDVSEEPLLDVRLGLDTRKRRGKAPMGCIYGFA